MPNKKFMIVVVSVLLLIFLVILALFIFSRRQQPSSNLTKEPVGSQTIVPTGSALPTGNQPREQDNPVSSSQEDQVIPVGKVEHFSWKRVIYYGNDQESNRLQSYFNANNLGDSLVVDMYDVSLKTTDLTELKNFSELCRLTGDPLANLPLAYDRDYKKCYLGYEEIIAYLNSEIEINKNWRK